jgi:hypothetical protein
MAVCPKCTSTRFTIKEINIEKADWRYWSIVCVECDCLICVIPIEDTNALIRQLADKLKLRLK